MHSVLFDLSVVHRDLHMVERRWRQRGIRDRIKSAQAVRAVYLNNNKDGLGLSGLDDYKNVKIGSIDVTPNQFGAVGADRIPPMVERYLIGLRISGPGNIAVKRS